MQQMRSSITLDSTKAYLPASAIKALKTQLEPLADEQLPAPQDLRAFWQKVATAIRSLDPTFANFEHEFTWEHVHNFGPHVLGFMGWQQVSAKPNRDWNGFVREVELVFGMSSEQLEE